VQLLAQSASRLRSLHVHDLCSGLRVTYGYYERSRCGFNTALVNTKLAEFWKLPEMKKLQGVAWEAGGRFGCLRVGSRVALQNVEDSQQIRLYKHFASNPLTKKMTGCQQRFSMRISIQFVPMVRLGDSNLSATVSTVKEQGQGHQQHKGGPQIVGEGTKGYSE